MKASKHSILIILVAACNILSMPFLSNNSKMSIEIDERIELITIMQSLAGYDSYFQAMHRPSIQDSNYQSIYLSNIAKLFNGFKNHPSIAIMNKAIRNGLVYNVPLSFVLHLAKPPQFSVAIPFDDDLLKYAGLAKEAPALINAIAAFYRDTRFDQFFKDNNEYYQKVLQNARNATPDLQKYVNFLEYFSGVKAKSYKIILSTVFSYNNYALKIWNGNDTVFYNVTSPGFKYGSHPSPIVVDGVPCYQKYALEFILTHEFSHSYVNPIVENNEGIADSIECLFNPIEDVMGKLAYPTWYSCLEEHLARAVTAVYFNREYGKESAMKEIQNQKGNWHFIYIEDIYKLDEEYLQHRNKYKKYQDFYPRIIEHLSKIPCEANGTASLIPNDSNASKK